MALESGRQNPYNAHVADILLQTKLIIPPKRPSLVPRLDLHQKLKHGLAGNLTLVSAPAGFGKTTLISGWIHQLEQASTWLSLDVEDNETGRFLLYVIAALQKACADVGKSALSLLQSVQPPPLDAFLTLLINDLADLSNQIILVMDDYHVIHNLDIHKGMTFILENQPQQLHMIIISREDPSFPLHRLRSSGQMTGIYAHDLRFSRDEAASFLSDTMRLKLTNEEISQLTQRTEGWIAGLQLAAISLQDLPNPGEFVTDFAGDDRYISDYLFSEVFERQSPEIQEFLLITTVLDRLCAPLCDAVVSNSTKRAHDILVYLEESNLFITPLDNKREWYRYHQLFSDFLHVRLRKNTNYQVSDIHQRASLWFEENGFISEALEHSLRAKNFQWAAALVEMGAESTLWRLGQWSTLLHWTESMPQDVVYEHPRLSLYYAWALYTTGQWERASAILPDVEEAVRKGTDELTLNNRLGEVDTIRACIYYESGEMVRASEQAYKALNLLDADNFQTRGAASYVLGLAANQQGHWVLAQKAYREAIAACQIVKNTVVTLMAMGSLVQLLVKKGQLRAAADIYTQARQLAEGEEGSLLGPVGVAFIAAGEILRERNHLQEAKIVLEKGVDLCKQQRSMPEAVLEGTITLARVLLAGGNASQAEIEVQRAESYLQEQRGRSGDVQPIISLALSYRARYWLEQGNLQALRRWLTERNLSFKEDVQANEFADYLLLARLFIIDHDFDQAVELLQGLDSLLNVEEAKASIIEIRILQSLAAQSQGDQPRAVALLSEALQLAEPEGYVRLFVEEGQPMIRLLKAGAANEGTGTYVQTLLQTLQEEYFPQQQNGIPETPYPKHNGLFEPLNDREMQVLKLMAVGLSNREIAAELYLSVNTIKAYSSRIYGKLAVRGRAAAIDRAHELGIL